MLTSKYFTTDDKTLKVMDGFEIPDSWWSRPHEYYFADKFLEKNEIIIDAGCGIEHPFKNYASKRVRKCFAIDKDERVKEFENTETLEFICENLTKLYFEDNSIDKVFCLSVLEHMDINARLETMKEFKRVIKDDGMIILTIDHPFMQTNDLVALVNACELEFVGSVEYDIPKNVIHGPYNGLKTFSAILKKVEIKPKTDKNKKTKEKTKHKTKELIPTETK